MLWKRTKKKKSCSLKRHNCTENVSRIFKSNDVCETTRHNCVQNFRFVGLFGSESCKPSSVCASKIYLYAKVCCSSSVFVSSEMSEAVIAGMSMCFLMIVVVAGAWIYATVQKAELGPIRIALLLSVAVYAGLKLSWWILELVEGAGPGTANFMVDRTLQLVLFLSLILLLYFWSSTVHTHSFCCSRKGCAFCWNASFVALGVGMSLLVLVLVVVNASYCRSLCMIEFRMKCSPANQGVEYLVIVTTIFVAVLVIVCILILARLLIKHSKFVSRTGVAILVLCSGMIASCMVLRLTLITLILHNQVLVSDGVRFTVVYIIPDLFTGLCIVSMIVYSVVLSSMRSSSLTEPLLVRNDNEVPLGYDV